MKGLVFDIRRFSVNDGPGIRTTVFLKGCPLNCLWCHNPESRNPEPETMTINQPLEGQSYVKHETVGRWMTVEEVVAACQLDLAFMSESGGGVTISGGEPLFQPDFTEKLASDISSIGISVAIDTSGYAARRILDRLLPHVSLWLYDYKGYDPIRHIENTGVDNSLILENLEYLISKNAQVILRYPVVPGLNDSEVDISGLFHLLDRYKGHLHEVHLLPYHRLGQDKLRRLNIQVPQIAVKTDSEKAARIVFNALVSLPVVVKIGG